MGFVESGGYVITTAGEKDYRRVVQVNDETLSRIAEILGIPAAERAQLIDKAKSILVYRGAGRPKK